MFKEVSSFILFFFSASCNAQVLDNVGLIGSWSIYEITWQSIDTTITIEPQQSGLFIFNDTHYSLSWVPQKQMRAPFEILAEPKDKEIQSAFKSIVFNSGTYEIKKNELITTAKIAKVPGFEGGRQFFKYNLNNNIMELTFYDEIYPNGTRPKWKGIWKTIFKLQKYVP